MHPNIPKFATIRSILSAWVLTNQHGSLVIETSRKIGARSDGDHSLGLHADKLCSSVFRGTIETEELLSNHSHFGLFTSFLSPSGSREWRSTVPFGEGAAMVAAVARNAPLEATTLRRCPTCVTEDLKRYGCAHWRLHHQWPFAHHCAEHGDVLQTRCKHCGSAVVRRKHEQMACDACHHCDSTEFEGSPGEMSEGYWLLLRLLYRTLAGERVWAEFFDTLLGFAELGDQMHSGRGTGFDELVRLWQVKSMGELGQVVGFQWPLPRVVGTSGSSAELPWILKAALATAIGVDPSVVQRWSRQ